MPVGIIPLLTLALTLDFLRRELLPQVEENEPVAEPYTPPLTGGQCPVIYILTISFLVISSNTRVSNSTSYTVTGAISGVAPFENENGANGIRITHAGGILSIAGNAGFYRDYQLDGVRRSDGLPDNCGNIPNPNPSPDIGSDGLSSVSAPNITNDENLVLGAPLVTIPSLGTALAALVSAVAAATDALDAVRKVMDAVKNIGDAIDKIKDWLEDKDKEDDTKKSLHVHNFGSIRKDGFLRLYPQGEVEGFKPVYIDLQLLSIPVGYGKYFGSLSPNFYRFKSLGHISFVSSSFGILETREIEFSRTSLNVPENAYGFYYHVGLEDAIRANVSMFYLKFDS